jgi:hypothetical protein
MFELNKKSVSSQKESMVLDEQIVLINGHHIHTAVY